MSLKENWERFTEIRTMFPNCAYCGESVTATPLADLYIVADRNRLAHRDCLAAEATDDAA